MERTDKVSLSPEHFGGNIEQKVVAELKKKVEGRISIKHGFTVLVFYSPAFDAQGNPVESGMLKVTLSPGMLDIDTGCAIFQVPENQYMTRTGGENSPPNEDKNPPTNAMQ